MLQDPFSQFAEAFVHDEIVRRGERFYRPRILGHRLRPYALWHLLYLRSVQHPLVLPEAWVDVHSFRHALQICTSRFGDARITPPLATRLRELAYLRLILWQIRATGSSKLLLQAHRQFATYQRDYVAPPIFARASAERKGGSTHAPQCDWILSRIARLMRAGMSEEQAWMCPIGASAWYAVSHAENAGAKFKLLTPERAAALAAARAASATVSES